MFRTTDALTRMTYRINEAPYNRYITGMISLDFSKVFEKGVATQIIHLYIPWKSFLNSQLSTASSMRLLIASPLKKSMQTVPKSLFSIGPSFYFILKISDTIIEMTKLQRLISPLTNVFSMNGRRTCLYLSIP